MKSRAQLVHLVQHHHWIARSRFVDGLDDVPGQRANIGAVMPAYFAFVMDAAKAQSNEFAIGGAGDTLTERSLADAGRTDEAKYRTLVIRIELAHG